MASNISMYGSRTATAVTGNPLPNPLPSVTTSGSTFQCCMHIHLPVRPMLVSTSSAISRILCLSHSFRSFGKKSSGGITDPPHPWMGSSTKAATCPAVARSRYSS